MTDDQIRPEVVQAYFDAVTTMDPAKLTAFAELAGRTGMTRLERGQAEALIAAALEAEIPHRDGLLEVFSLLAANRSPANPMSGATWAELFDELTRERAARLGDLYHDLPDGAREEYDRRYGRPPG